MNPQPLLFALCLFGGSLMGSGAADARNVPEWPQFRGPNSQGVSDGSQPPAEFGAEKALLWKTPLPPGVSSPCVSAGQIFITAFDSSRKQLELICVEAGTGGIRWRRDAPARELEKVHEASSPANTSPATDGVRIYVQYPMFGIVAYSLDGNEVWTKRLRPAKVFFGSGSSPALIDGKLIIRDSGSGHVLALQRETGETLWQSTNASFGWGYATPVSWREGNRTVVGIRSTGRFDVFDAGTGTNVWRLRNTPPNACATPAVSDDLIFISGVGHLGNRENLAAPPEFASLLAQYDSNHDGRIALTELPDTILLLDREVSNGMGNRTWKEELGGGRDGKNRSYDESEWIRATAKVLADYRTGAVMTTGTFAVRTGGQGVASNHVVWTEVKGVPEVPSPLLYRGHLYFIKNGGVLTCRNPATGQTVYEERIGAEGGYFASPVAADGRIYVASDRGLVTVLRAGPRFQVLHRANLREPIQATPALRGKQILIRTAAHLWAFGVHDGQAPATASKEPQ